MRELDESSVHVIVTSQLYWQLKDYGAEGQIGFDSAKDKMENSSEGKGINTEQIYKEMKTALTRLVGEECWAISAGKGVGSMVLMNFGRKIPRERPLKTFYISADYQKCRGEFTIFVQHCVWRVDGKKEIICSHSDSNLPDGPMMRGLNQLSGQRLASYDLSFPGFDLALHFDNGLTLRLFCSQLNPIHERTNYHLGVPGLIYIIGSRSQPRIEPGDLAP